MIISTLCYIEKDNKYLMLHRTKKRNKLKELEESHGKSIENKRSWGSYFGSKM